MFRRGHVVKTVLALACATVWSDAGRPRGSVTFKIEGKAATATAPLGHGTGCVKLPRLRPAVSPTAGDLGEWLRQFCWSA